MHLITDDTPRSGQSLTLQVDGDALTIKVGTSCFGALRHLHKLIPEPFRFRLRSISQSDRQSSRMAPQREATALRHEQAMLC